jgi:hydroxymethylbilane synthase
VTSRLQKLDDGQFSALILAAAGLKRLHLEDRISRYFSPEEILPAAGQGVLAVQMRAGEDFGFLAGFHHPDTAACVTAERAFVRAIDGGCSSPVAAYATLDGGVLTLRGMDEAMHKASLSGPPAEAAQLGVALARLLRSGD